MARARRRSIGRRGTGELVTRADWSYRSEFFHDVANSAQAFQEAYDLLNLRLAFVPESGRYEVALFSTNALDERYFEHAFNSPPVGSATAITARPREWGLTFDWRF